MLNSYNILLLIILFICIYLYLSKNKKKCSNIAHGCGKIDSTKYTNCLEAFIKSYSIGYKNIEIDLLSTKDGHIVGAHDWKKFKELTNFSCNSSLNFEFIKTSRILKKYHIIYDDMIYNLLKKYSNVNIYTDKIKNYLLLKKYGKIMNRLYIEVFNYNQYYISKKIGFKHVMLNIEKVNHLNKFLSLKNTSIDSITISPSVFYSCKYQLLQLFKKNVNIYAYLIENTSDIRSAFCKYINGFYID